MVSAFHSFFFSPSPVLIWNHSLLFGIHPSTNDSVINKKIQTHTKNPQSYHSLPCFNSFYTVIEELHVRNFWNMCWSRIVSYKNTPVDTLSNRLFLFTLVHCLRHGKMRSMYPSSDKLSHSFWLNSVTFLENLVLVHDFSCQTSFFKLPTSLLQNVIPTSWIGFELHKYL